MKRWFVCLVALVSVLLVVPASAQNTLMQTFTAQDGSFSFQHPASWTASEMPADSSAPGVTTVLLSITSTSFLSVATYGPENSVFNTIGSSFAPDTPGARTSTVQVNGRDAIRLELKGTIIEYILSTSSGNRFVALVTASPDAISDLEPLLLTMATSFRAVADATPVPEPTSAPATATVPATDQSGAQLITLANAAQIVQNATLKPDSAPNSLAFSPDGKTLAVGTGNDITLYDSTTGDVLNMLQGHTDSILSVAFSADGKILASGSQDQTVRLWDATTGESLNTITVDSGYPRSRVAISPDGKLVAQGNYGPLRMWDVATGNEITTIVATGGDVGVNNVAFSPDGKTLATAGGDYNVQLWEVATGKLINTLQGHTGSVESVAFSPDGKTLASASDDKTIILWDVATGKALATLEGHTNPVTSVAFSADGSVLASSDGSQIMLWDVAGGQNLTPLQVSVGFSNVAFSPDGTTLAFSDADGAVELWGIPIGS